jgi:hypothetical protein
MVPYVGEAIDAYDCYHGSKLACSSFFVPFVSGRLLGAGQDILRAAPSGAVTCLANSFVPGTEVLMADGTTKRIKDVKVGDWVWAHDPETGETGPRQVIDTIIGDGEKKLVDIEVLGDTITATDGHPFWVDDQGQWIDAADLVRGDELLSVNGATIRVSSLSTRVQIQRVHNLTVDGIHTYFVVVDGSPALVHNQGGPCLAAINIARHSELEGHVLPAVDDLAVYVDDLMTSVPGQAFTRGREGWWDPDLGAIVIREGGVYGSVFIPDDGYAYFLRQLAE